MIKNNSNTTTDLSIKAFAKKFAAEAFHLDKRVFRTLITLFARPGHLTLAYFEDKTEKYVQPLKLYFVINLVFFLLTPMLNTSQFQIFSFNLKSLTGSNPFYQEIVRNEIQQKGVSEEIYQERFNAHLKYNQPAFIFLMIPFFALILNLVYLRNRRFYVEHLFFSIHFLSFFLLFLLLILFLYRIFSIGFVFLSDGLGLLAFGLLAVLLIGLLAYLVVGIRNFYNSSILAAVIKSIILFAGFFVTMSVYVQFLFFFAILALKLGY